MCFLEYHGLFAMYFLCVTVTVLNHNVNRMCIKDTSARAGPTEQKEQTGVA